MKYEEFRSQILKLKKTRVYQTNNSLGVYDAYKWIRKNKWLNIGRIITEHEFYYIIREVNKLLAQNIINGKEVVFPCRMGKLELRKIIPTVKIVDGKVKNTYPIDWDKTLKLWYEDKEAYNNKTLIKLIEKQTFKIHYNRTNANYKNKSFYEFKVNRTIKRTLKDNIKNNHIDAFEL